RETFIEPDWDCTHHEFQKAKPFVQFDVRKFMRDDGGIDSRRCKTKPDARIADTLCAAASEPLPTAIGGAGEDLGRGSQLAIEIGDLRFAFTHGISELRPQQPRHGGIDEDMPGKLLETKAAWTDQRRQSWLHRKDNASPSNEEANKAYSYNSVPAFYAFAFHQLSLSKGAVEAPC